MLQTRKRNKNYIMGYSLIFIGIAVLLSKNIYFYYINNNENKAVEKYIEVTSTEEPPTNTQDETYPLKKTNKDNSYNYVGVLEIPSISLKRGFVDIDDKNNNVNKNIQILKDSDMPNIVNGNMILASHSGTSHISFFKNLDKIKNNDLIYVYYKGIKYSYIVVNIYEEEKDGTITIHRNKSKTTLTLTTCTPNHKGYQLIIISELIDKENY